MINHACLLKFSLFPIMFTKQTVLFPFIYIYIYIIHLCFYLLVENFAVAVKLRDEATEACLEPNNTILNI
jgi:hypothetical protein